MSSEFGKGLCYNLGLFLCHSERAPMYSKEMAGKMGFSEQETKRKNASMWFYGATDHMYELEIPEYLPTTLKRRLRKLVKTCFDNRMRMDDNVDPKIQQWAIQEAKDLLRLIDKFHGVKTKKGSWE